MTKKKVVTKTPRAIPPPTVRDIILAGEAQLDQAGVYFGHGTDNALDEAAWLAASTLQLSPDELDAHLADTLSPTQQEALTAIFAQRIAMRKPAAYLLHEAWFAGLRFYVDERVIVPRSHLAEFIREEFQPWLGAKPIHRILDLCTGSGCIAIALAHYFPSAKIDASDISYEALAVAKTNVSAYHLEARINLMRSDLFAQLPATRYDLIVTNPPYVDQASMATLPAEFGCEPLLAFVSGASGLDAIKSILANAADYLTPDGLLVAEVGNSCEPLQACFPSVPFIWLTTSTGDESVFLLTAEQLHAHQGLFKS